MKNDEININDMFLFDIIEKMLIIVIEKNNNKYRLFWHNLSSSNYGFSVVKFKNKTDLERKLNVKRI